MNKKILFITPGLTRGGAETQMMKVVSHLKDQDVMILSLKSFNDFNTEGIKIHFLGNWKKKPLQNAFAVYKLIRDFRPDTTVAFMFPAIITARVFKMVFGYKLISSIRTPVLQKKWYKTFKLTSSLDDAVVYNSASSKTTFEDNNLAKKNGIIINNAIAIPENISFNRTDKHFVWCCVAHFRPEKDYETLFKAIALLKESDFRVNILGHINNQTWPYEMIKKLGIESKVNILGFQRNVNEYLEKSNAFILSSRWEGSPNAVLEAMAYGKPVVASSVIGISDLVREANCGFLFEKGNEVDLAGKMLQIMHMANTDLYSLGRNGRRYVELHYAEEPVMQQWLNVLDGPKGVVLV